IINVPSTDNACFAWSVVAALHPAQKNVERESSYSHYSSVLNLQDIQFPMTLSQIKKFEALNDISINVYAIEKGIVPIRLTDRKRSKHVNLLYVKNDSVQGHFALIKDLSRLVGSQINRKGHKKYFCDRRLHYFDSSAKLEMHSEDCEKINDCAIRLPSKDDKKERVPFVVYADLECALERIDSDSQSATHTVGYYVQCSYDSSLSGYRFRRDKDCIAWFAEELRQLAHIVQSVISANVPMADFTFDDWEKFNSVSHCHVCEKPFTPDDTRSLPSHRAIQRPRALKLQSKLQRFALHTCSPSYIIIYYPVTTFILLSRKLQPRMKDVDLLPVTKEKYISFTKHVDSTKIDQKNCVQLRFIDSYRFLASSLDKLSSFLNNDKLRVLRREFSHLSEENFYLLTRKGVFPYEYIDCSEKLNELCLPSRESIYSSLTDSTVSESDYAHAVNVWQRFSIQTLAEYSDLYLKTDVLLLADVFENFRDSCIASYGLDSAYYYTLLHMGCHVKTYWCKI
ncbi:hypothetical protein ALC57_12578, partial [Trachymyrmex cornetzi]